MSRLIDASWHPLADGNPPVWATGWGQDRRGVFVEFEVGGVTTALRWIPPGRFLMGSPADEEGRRNDEGPQHPVIIGQGFWLMETPCTQALWQTVMDGNPSSFKGEPTLPVESVSWNDVQEFLSRINQRIPGLSLTLPTEAQWEHACRAGTTDARYGPLDDIAWYSTNSGGKTHPVGEKQPNPWGLHDMLGNVWEWCRDGRRDYSEKAQTDPTGPLEAGADRALRGGSWVGDARGVRAASRYWSLPDDRYDDFGFRCSRVQS